MENKAKQIIEKFNDHPFSVTSMEGFEMANAYLQLKSALELANAEKIGLLQLIDDIETENKKMSEANMNLRAALEEINTGVMSMYLNKGHMIDSFKKVAREALEKLK